MIYLITGGAGSFGQNMTRALLKLGNTEKVVIYSRDEFKHATMRSEFNEPRLRFISGDVRNYSRMRSALRGVDVAIHAAAMKRVEICEYNPSECVDVNINGTDNFLRSCIDTDVKRAVLISTDKAVAPVNLYGASKMAAERLFLAANVYKPIFNVVRYGNVMKSRGSVVNHFADLVEQGAEKLPVTSPNMTRFCLQYEDATNLVKKAIQGIPQLVYVAKAPSYSLVRLCAAFGREWEKIDRRPGEKLHEVLIGPHEIDRAYDMGDYFEIYPENPADSTLTRPDMAPLDSEYSSYDNSWWLSVDEIKELI